MPGGYKRGWEPLQRHSREELVEHYRRDPAIEIWSNGRYQVICRTQEPEGGNPMKHLSVHLHDRSPMRNWRHLQQIKNEVCGEDWTGIEFFPPEGRLVDSANEYHLFCFPPEVEFGVGFMEEESQPVVTDDELAAEYTADPNHKGRQEPWEEGLTTGRTPASAASRARARHFMGDRYGYEISSQP